MDGCGCEDEEKEEEEEEGKGRRKEGPEIIRLADREIGEGSLNEDEDGDFFSEVDAAVASLKLREKASKQGKVNRKRIEKDVLNMKQKEIDEDEEVQDEEEEVEEGIVEEIGVEDVWKSKKKKKKKAMTMIYWLTHRLISISHSMRT